MAAAAAADAGVGRARPVGPADATVIPRFAGLATFAAAAGGRRGAALGHRRRRRALRRRHELPPRRPLRPGGGPPGARACCGPTTRRRTRSPSSWRRWSTPATSPARPSAPRRRWRRSRRRPGRCWRPIRAAAGGRRGRPHHRAPVAARHGGAPRPARPRCTSTRISTRGTPTSGSASRTARRSGGPGRRGCSATTRASTSACAAPSTAPAT